MKHKRHWNRLFAGCRIEEFELQNQSVVEE